VSKTILVLASNSPRRRHLLGLGGWTFHVRPADVDESLQPGESPAAYVLRLAEAKARACAASARSNEVFLGSDTAVVDGDAILGKPKDGPNASQMLRKLRGRIHQVYTGIAIYRPSDGKLVTDLCISNVPMREYSEDEIAEYVASGDPFDKAGAYAIQHEGFHPVEKMSGCYASVMGLPLCHLTRSLAELQITPLTDISIACQADLQYACPVTRAILRGEMVG
jgi:septum formation protein